MNHYSQNQVIELNREYLRIVDNVINYLDNFNQRFMDYETSRIEVNSTSQNNSNRLLNPFSRGNRFRGRRNRTNSSLRRQTPIYQWPSTFSNISPPERPPPIRPPPIVPSVTPPILSSNINSLRTTPRWSFNSVTSNSTNTQDNTDVITNILNNTLYGSSYSNRHPTYNDIITSTTTTTYLEANTGLNTQTMCPISREQFQNFDVLLKINHCGHIFKKNSLLNWFETSSKCPVCRHDIRHSSSRYNTDLSNNVTDLSNNVTDLSNNVTDLSNNVTDLSNNEINNTISNSEEQFQNLINNNISQVLDNIGNVVLDNIEGVIDQALNNVTDLSNNQLTAGFEYTVEFPGFNNLGQ